MTTRQTRFEASRTSFALALASAALLAACGGSSGDTTPPTLVITDNVAAATTVGNVTFTFTFSEDVGTSFLAADVTVTGGTKGALTKVSETVYTMVVEPTPYVAGTINVSVAAGAFSDLAGNASTAAATASQAYLKAFETFDSAAYTAVLTGFGGAEDSTVVADPTNAANKVAKVVKSATAELWAGSTIGRTAQPYFSSKVPFDSSNTRMTVKVWSAHAPIQVRLKLEEHNNNTATVETEATVTTANAWQTLTFDFANQVSGTAALDLAKNYDMASIFFNFGVTGATAGARTYYFDDVVFIGGGGVVVLPTAPSAAPTRPSVAAANVISLFSDAYTNVAVDTWRTVWSAATLTDVTVGADHVKKYSALDNVGVETIASPVNASTMTHLHLDVWTANATTFRVKLVDLGANGVWNGAGSDDSEFELAFTSATTPALQAAAWTSLEIPLSSFTGLAARAHLGQYIFSALPTGAGTVYVANVYFHK